MKRLITVGFLVILTTAFVPSATADSSYRIPMFGCAAGVPGLNLVPANTPLFVQGGWASGTTGLAETASIVPASERFIDRDFGFPIERQYRLHIVGHVEPKKGFRAYDLPANGNRVQKDRDLRFRIAECTVPPPYQIYWKVRNTGDEAAKVGQLRGEIREDAGGHRHSESTKYRGSHYVECYIVKNGRVVAVDRQPVLVL